MQPIFHLRHLLVEMLPARLVSLTAARVGVMSRTRVQPLLLLRHLSTTVPILPPILISTKHDTISPQQRRNSRVRLFLRVLLGLGITLPGLKIYFAIRPLLGEASPEKDPFVLKALSFVGKGDGKKDAASPPPRGLAWYISEASDRLIRDLYVAVKIVADYFFTLKKDGDGTDWPALHQRGADNLLALCEVNKGVYIKLGQHVGALDYLLPEQYVNTLRVLTHAAPTDSYETVRAVIEEEFGGRPVEDLFDSFDPAPIASASLAQVHVARLKGSGQKVAVKVQHAGLRETSLADIYTVSALMYAIKVRLMRGVLLLVISPRLLRTKLGCNSTGLPIIAPFC